MDVIHISPDDALVIGKNLHSTIIENGESGNCQRLERVVSEIDVALSRFGYYWEEYRKLYRHPV